MSGIVVDRAILYLLSQPDGFQPGDAFAFVIFEIAPAGFKVRVKSGKLKLINPLTIEGVSKEETLVFEIEEDARRCFKEKIELFTNVGFRPSSPRHKTA